MSLRHLSIACGVLLLAACGEPEVSDLAFADVRNAAAAGDEAAFRNWFKEIRGERVAWRGQAVEVAKEHGDDFVEITTLLVDVDGLAGGSTEPDVVFPVSATFAETVVPGREVAFTGLIQDFEWQRGEPLLRLDVRQVQ